jgi:AraC-like DNA-binding protein
LVRVFLECLAGYMSILPTGCEVGYNEVSGKGQLFWRWPIKFDSPTKPANLYLVASLVFRIRAAAGDKWVPLSVLFEHKAPMVADRELSVFGPRPRFDADKTSSTLDVATLNRPMPTANEEMFAIYKHHAALLLREASLERDLATQVRNAISERLTRETPTLEVVSNDIGISARAMQRGLDRVGLSFERMLDDMRFAIAERLLRETDRPVIQVTYEVGYSSQSTFTRAVRRWLDASPRANRQRFRDFEREQLNGKRAHGTGVHVSNGD